MSKARSALNFWLRARLIIKHLQRGPRQTRRLSPSSIFGLFMIFMVCVFARVCIVVVAKGHPYVATYWPSMHLYSELHAVCGVWFCKPEPRSSLQGRHKVLANAAKQKLNPTPR